MRIGKIPYILLIVTYLACMLLLVQNVTDVGKHGADTREARVMAPSSPSQQTRDNSTPAFAANAANRWRNYGRSPRGNGIAGLYPEESTQGSAPMAQVTTDDARIQTTGTYHRGRILVKFSPEEVAHIQQGYKPDLHGRLGRMVSKGGFYEVFPAEGESVEELLERYWTEPPDMIEYAQLDYECTAVQEAASIDASLIDLDLEKDDPYFILDPNAKAEMTITEYIQLVEDPNQKRALMWFLDRLNVEPAWQETIGISSVVVALLDTGIAYEDYAVPKHEALQVQGSTYAKAPNLELTHFWTNPVEAPDNEVDDDLNGYIDDLHGYDFVNKDAHPNDTNGHGTHLAGIIAAHTLDPDTDTGIARECTLMNLKVLDYRGIGYASSIAEAIYYAVDHGAKVINMSLAWAPGINPGPIVHEAIAYAANAGVVITAGTGNNLEGTVCFPAAYPEVIAVGGTEYKDKRAYYSNYGPQVEVAMPGGYLRKDFNKDGYADGILQLTYATKYQFDSVLGETLCDTSQFVYRLMQGTSMATAELSGVVGLMLSANPNLSMKEIRILLRETALDIGPTGWDQEFGYGVVDAGAAVSRAKAGLVVDADQDGYASVASGGEDCDDNNPDIYPGASEIPNDGIDQDCNGFDLADGDGDGYFSVQSGGRDCDDSNPDIYPGAIEIPNDGIDQDCNGFDLIDADGDGYASVDSGGTDCNDTDPAINPGALEIPNDGIDQDCNGKDLIDVDEDGYASLDAGGTDCNDADPNVHPGAPETLNDGIDQDCDGVDLIDLDGDGYISALSGGNDCNDNDPAINPGALEIEGDGIDQNCDGSDLVSVSAPDDPCGGENEADCNSCSQGTEIELECP